MLTAVDEAYRSLFNKCNALFKEYEDAEQSVVRGIELDAAVIQKRIANLEKELERIDELRARIEQYTSVAEKGLCSRNHSSIVPREINLNKLRNWAMMMGTADPDSHGDDPYARRIHYLCLCNLMYLDRKEHEFQVKICEYRSGELSDAEEQSRRKAAAKIRKRELENAYLDLFATDEFNDFVHMVRRAYAWCAGEGTFGKQGVGESNAVVSFGTCLKRLPMPEGMVRMAALERMGELFDKDKAAVRIPVGHGLDEDMVISIACSGSRTLQRQLWSGIQNYLLNAVCKGGIGARRVVVLDALHYNSSVLGALGELCGTVTLLDPPRSSEEIEDQLKQLVFEFTDIDEKLGMAESVAEYNAAAATSDTIRTTTLLLVGYPAAFSATAVGLVRRILNNYERYGITVILIDPQFAPRQKNAEPALPIDIVEGVVRIQMNRSMSLFRRDDGLDFPFEWYQVDYDTNRTMFDAIIDEATIRSQEDAGLSNVYTDTYPLDSIPSYTRGVRRLSDLPFGIRNNEVETVSLNDENFAAYLMGASGSGKSSLLHTLIAGIMRQYHPDDVELWLADFKMAEFAQYMDPLPPHVKYILLDESPELVYNLLDKLTDEMMRRQRFFMRTGKKFEDTADLYMPMIVVILDEFSIMSQAIAEADSYKLKLQNLLAKGRALGFKFIFASQTFTTGVRGLTPTAKDQIQMRIAMKNSMEEITSTLELSSSTKTDQVKNWMDALPPHFTLTKYRDGDAMKVMRLQTMYFKGEGAEAFAPIRSFVDMLRDGLTKMGPAMPGAETASLSPSSYYDKNPVVVDGNSYRSFEQSAQGFMDWMADERTNSASYCGDETFLTVGVPRLMETLSPIVLSPEIGENVLLVSSGQIACSSSVVKSILESSRMQGKKATLIAHPRDRMFMSYQNSWRAYDCVTDTADVVSRLYATYDAISNHDDGDEIVVVLGAERVISDLSYFEKERDARQSDPEKKYANTKGIVNVSAEESAKIPSLRERMRAAKKKPRTDSKETTAEETDTTVRSQPPVARDKEEATVRKAAAVKSHDEHPDPREALDLALRMGSRFHKYIVLVFNTTSGLRQAKVNLELLRHRISFAVSADDSVRLFSKRGVASGLPEHVFCYSDSLRNVSFRPYIHRDITWEDWSVDDQGNAVSYINV